jgi:hexokinase
MTRLDSFADVPKDLLKELQQLEKLFTVDTAMLKQITEHFESELAKGMLSLQLSRYGSVVCSFVDMVVYYAGLSVEGGSIVSLILDDLYHTWPRKLMPENSL